MKAPKPEDVDSYLAGSPGDARPVLEELRRIIRTTVPEAEEGISWGVPFYRYHDDLAGFAVYKKHVSFGFGAAVFQPEDRGKLEENGYKTGKGTLRIRFDQKVPAAAIKKILKAKARMNEGGSKPGKNGAGNQKRSPAADHK
jgi:uncharacterized protein YdhG (YjbR/CyaY superfamily)